MTEERKSLTERSWDLRLAVQRRIAEAAEGGYEDPGMKLFGVGISTINTRLGQLERATRSIVHNLQPRMLFDPLRRERAVNQRWWARGLEGHVIASGVNNAQHMALLAVCHPDAWVGEVELSGLAIDERLALFPGPLSVQGQPTAWLCSHPDLVAELCGLWTEIKREAMPIHDVPGLVRLTERQLATVSLLSQGHKDATIARLQGVSPRTVTSDVGRILDALGVGTRWEAGIVLGRVSMPA